MSPRVATVSLPGNLSAAKVLSTPKARIEAQELMDGGRATYAVARIVGGKAEVLTRHEKYREVLDAMPTIWRCKVNPDHVWPRLRAAYGPK